MRELFFSPKKNRFPSEKKMTIAKGTITHPVSACVFRIALQFFINYLD